MKTDNQSLCVSDCVFPDRFFLFPLLIFLRHLIPHGSPLEALDDERFSIVLIKKREATYGP